MTISKGLMINENQAVEAISRYLKDHGWSVEQQLDTKSHGIDIIAQSFNHKILIEVKGGTSASHTSNFGHPFDRSQARTHIGVALFKAGETLTSNPDAIIALGFPKERDHMDLIDKIKLLISRLDIFIFYVDEKLNVEVVRPREKVEMQLHELGL